MGQALMDCTDELAAVSDKRIRQKICRRMQEEFWLNPSYVPLGLWYQPTGFRANLQDMRDGWPQCYRVRRV